MLIAVDQSENAKRAVTYAARMVKTHPEITITVFKAFRKPDDCACPGSEAECPEYEKIRNETLSLVSGLAGLIAQAGIPQERIRTKVSAYCPPQTAADEILREKREGGYETVVVGRRGVSRKEEFMFGSVSARVMREAGPQAVWVVA